MKYISITTLFNIVSIASCVTVMITIVFATMSSGINGIHPREKYIDTLWGQVGHVQG